MKFYLEALKNDLDIASLDCDIEIDNACLTIDYYSSKENFYKESDSDDNMYFMEATRSIGQSIKDMIKSVIKFIDACVYKIRELFTGKKFKDLKQKYEEAVKNNPKLKNVKIEFEYDSDYIIMRDKNNKAFFAEWVKMIDGPSQEIEDQLIQKYNIIKDKKKKFNRDIAKSTAKSIAKSITLDAAFGLVCAAEVMFIKNTLERRKLLKQIDEKAEESDSKIIKRLGKLAHDKNTKYNSQSILRTLINGIKGTTNDEMKYIMGAMGAVDARLKAKKSVDDAATDNMAILDSKNK